MRKKIAIISAGPGGLAAAKEVLAHGMNPVVFESAPTIGGVWRPGGLAWPGMMTNLSKYTCTFPDFPHRPDTPVFPSRDDMYQYLCDYAAAHRLGDHIHLNTRVVAANPASGGRWHVTTRTTGAHEDDHHVVDGLIIASGAFSQPHRPPIRGIRRTDGPQIVHSAHFDPRALQPGEIVTIIGGGFSAIKIAATAVDHGARHVNLIARHPLPYVLPRWIGDQPLDIAMNSPQKRATMRALPVDEQRRLRHDFLHAAMGDAPSHIAFCTDVTRPPQVAISDTFMTHVRSGKISVYKGSVRVISEFGVSLSTHHHLPAHHLVTATGFRLTLPFLDAATSQKLGFDPRDSLQALLLHQATFGNLPHFGAVGLYRGPYFATMGLQALALAQCFSGQKP